MIVQWVLCLELGYLKLVYIFKSEFKICTLPVKFKNCWNSLDVTGKRFLAVHHILIWQGGSSIQGLQKLKLYENGKIYNRTFHH